MSSPPALSLCRPIGSSETGLESQNGCAAVHIRDTDWCGPRSVCSAAIPTVDPVLCVNLDPATLSCEEREREKKGKKMNPPFSQGLGVPYGTGMPMAAPPPVSGLGYTAAGGAFQQPMASMGAGMFPGGGLNTAPATGLAAGSGVLGGGTAAMMGAGASLAPSAALTWAVPTSTGYPGAAPGASMLGTGLGGAAAGAPNATYAVVMSKVPKSWPLNVPLSDGSQLRTSHFAVKDTTFISPEELRWLSRSGKGEALFRPTDKHSALI